MEILDVKFSLSKVFISKEFMILLFIAMGRKDGMTPKKLVDFIVKKAKVKQAYIKNAEVYDAFSFVSVAFKEAEIIVEAFAEIRKGKKPLIEKAKSKK